MKRHLATMKHAPLILASSLALLVGIGLGAYFHKETIIVRENTADTPAAMRSVNLMLDFGNGEVRTWNTVSWHEAMSVVDLLTMVGNVDGINVVTEGTDEKNLVVTAVSDVATNKESRWQYWVNNTHEPRIANKYFLKPGDIVVWKFAKEQVR